MFKKMFIFEAVYIYWSNIVMDKFTNNSFFMSALAEGNEKAFDALFVNYIENVYHK